MPLIVLVPHSNAGLYVAAMVAARPVQAVVRLPPWGEWWSEEDMAVVYPDASTRAGVEAEQRRLPLAYFDAAVPSPAGWGELPAAYLAFRETYAEETAPARGRGWPVEVLVGEHLHLLVDPVAVAGAILALSAAG